MIAGIQEVVEIAIVNDRNLEMGVGVFGTDAKDFLIGDNGSFIIALFIQFFGTGQMVLDGAVGIAGYTEPVAADHPKEAEDTNANQERAREVK